MKEYKLKYIYIIVNTYIIYPIDIFIAIVL